MDEVQIQSDIEIEYHEDYEQITIRPHFHNAYEVIYILDGQVEVVIGNKTYLASKNHMIFISNLESHELNVLQYPYKRYFILIQADYLNATLSEPVLASIFRQRPHTFKHILRFQPNAGLPAGYIEEPTSGQSAYAQIQKQDIEAEASYTNVNSKPAAGTLLNTDDIIGLLERMYQDYHNQLPYYHVSMSNSLTLLLISLYRVHPDYFPISGINQTMSNIIAIQKLIDENFTMDLRLKELAGKYYMDMYYLSHTFKKVTGFTFKDYLILQRLAHAKKELLHTEDNITTVAIKSGFNNVNHFIRLFKRHEGITPYQFKKQYKK